MDAGGSGRSCTFNISVEMFYLFITLHFPSSAAYFLTAFICLLMYWLIDLLWWIPRPTWTERVLWLQIRALQLQRDVSTIPSSSLISAETPERYVGAAAALASRIRSNQMSCGGCYAALKREKCTFCHEVQQAVLFVLRRDSVGDRVGPFGAWAEAVMLLVPPVVTHRASPSPSSQLRLFHVHTICAVNAELLPAAADSCFWLADDPEGAFVPPEFDDTGSTFEVRDVKSCPTIWFHQSSEIKTNPKICVCAADLCKIKQSKNERTSAGTSEAWSGFIRTGFSSWSGSAVKPLNRIYFWAPSLRV